MATPVTDGFHHPASEQELVELVRLAHQEGRQCRVRGATHSVSHAIYGDAPGEFPNRVNVEAPPPGNTIEIMLDHYRALSVRDESRRLVEADAGIHLGADPNDPTGTADLDSSLLYQLWHEHGWTLSNLGGITRQTVSGFTATGSSGGSTQYSTNDNLWGFRVIDGTGAVHEFTRDDPDPDLFYAMAPNLGLLGVVSKIMFECEDTFNISGQEATSTIADCAIDLFGPGTAEKPSLAQFLRDAEYARLLWWPQRGAERVQVWQAQRMCPQPGFLPHRYEEFANDPDVFELLASVVYTVLGDIDDLSRSRPQIERIFEHAEGILQASAPLRRLGALGRGLAKLIAFGLEHAVEAAIAVLKPFAGAIDARIPVLFPKLLGKFVTLDSEASGIERNEPQSFRDYAWQGLPMDNEVDDTFLPTAFTELWIPLPYTERAMRLLQEYFAEPEDAREAYRRTGIYGWELYAAKANSFWLSASYSTGDDEWADGVFRIDPYWFAADPGDPARTFYAKLWELFRSREIPFRLHWGKYQPIYEQGDREWVDFFKAQYPRWEDFLALRARRDPGDVLLTRYWRDRFGLWQQSARAAGVLGTRPAPTAAPDPLER